MPYKLVNDFEIVEDSKSLVFDYMMWVLRHHT